MSIARNWRQIPVFVSHCCPNGHSTPTHLLYHCIRSPVSGVRNRRHSPVFESHDVPSGQEKLLHCALHSGRAI
ncbi:hypothetical protein L596_003700 [Steinernema carpocapsae]|uniref:Uncharacterized protein n=1 Tax=Steinernema carpocapsae TaxID=34508 RepID=A0A4U8UV15_STECR|nr:hypothetical protein L596_003700 [Steinernema carpocapsae]